MSGCLGNWGWWSGGGGGIIKEHEAALGTDAHVHYLDCGGAYKCQNIKSHINMCSPLWDNYTSKMPFKSELRGSSEEGV